MRLSPKQEETLETIFKLTQEYNYPPTLDEIAASMGITKGTLQYHMSALKKKNAATWNPGSARSVRVIDAEYLKEFAKKYPKMGTAYKGEPESSSEEFTTSKQQIPILGKIAAGAPLDVAEQTDEYLELDSYFQDGCYALKVKGESMVDALISDGDLVLIEPKQTAHNGEIVVALVDEEAATLKRLYKEDDGRVRLQPENPTMDPIFLDSMNQLKIQGIVKGVIRKI